ncbi:uncharacterized protein PG986_005330 [Apiospora aurea]|uniref:Uncharacterized protein n=1 Tax=Apiospora aurea TaxID=335848 RepID=A0ABR1QH97_9PEZI
MPSGLAATSTHPGAIPSASSAMAVHGLLDHDPDHDHDGDDSITDGRKAKRELSQSKRAAQNRAAQVCDTSCHIGLRMVTLTQSTESFQAKKGAPHKKLEQEVRDFRTMEETYKAVQNENYALREYVIQLQSRLMDSQIELPQPPPGLALHPPRPNAPRAVAHPQPPANVLEPAQATSSAGSLADVAAAVHAGISAREPPRDMPVDGLYNRVKPETSEERSDDEIRRQLQRDTTLPPPSSLRA